MASDVKLSVDLEAGDVTSAASELQQRLRAIFEDSAGKELNLSMQQLLNTLIKDYNQLNNMQSSLDKLANTEITTKDYDKAVNTYVTARRELEKLTGTIDETKKRIADLTEHFTLKPEQTGSWQRYSETFAKYLEQYQAYAAEKEKIDRQLARSTSIANYYQKAADATGLQNNIDLAKKWSAQVEELQRQSNVLGESMDKLNSLAEKTARGLQALKDKGSFIKAEHWVAIQKENDALNELNTSAEELKTTMTQAKEQMDRLNEQGKGSVMGIDTDKYKKDLTKLEEHLNRTTVDIRKFNQEITDLNKTDYGDVLRKSFGGSIVDFANNINQLPQMIENAMDEVVKTLPPHVQAIYSVIKLGVKQIVGAYKEAFSEVSTIIKNGLTKAANVATTAVKALVKEVAKLASSAFLGPIKKLGDSISNIGKQANSSAPSLKQIGRAFLQYGLGARSLYRLINKLRTALFAGFADLALVDEPFNAAMSSIISSLEYLKNAFAAAFAPIIQAVAPALSAFINMIAEAVVWLGQLIALLTGQPFKIAVPTFKDYASSTSAGAAAAKNAANAEKERAKALKKTAKEMRTIAGFDDVEILKAPDDNDSSSSSPSSGGGGGGGGGLAFQTAPLADGLQKFADMLKEIWRTADAYDLGVLFGKKLGDLLRAFNENVPKIEAVTTKIAKIIASFLAGFLSVNETFAELGRAIGNGINIIFHTLDAFLKTFMNYDGFKNLGKDIYLTIINALRTIDWNAIYSVFGNIGIGLAQVLNEVLTKPDLWEEAFIALTNAIKALLLRAYYFVTTLKWDEIGTAAAAGINAGIANFPFSLVSSTAAAFINGIFTFLGNAAANIHWDELGHNIGKSVMDFFDRVDWRENGQSLGSFMQGLFDSLDAFVEEIDFEKVAQDVVDFIKGFFEKFNWQENADTILKLLNGLLDVFLGVVDDIGWQDIVNNIWKYIQTSPEVAKFLENIWSTISEIAMTKLKLSLMKFTTIGGMVIWGILEGMLTPIANGMAWLQTHIVDPIIDWFFKLFDVHSPAETTKPVGEGIIGGILQGMLDAILGVGAWINEHIFIPVRDAIHNAFGIAGNVAEKIVNVGSGIIQGIWNGITDKLGAPLSWIQEHIATPIKGGLETAFGIVGGVASKIKEIGSAVVNGFKRGAEEEEPKLTTKSTEINKEVQEKLKDGDWSDIGSTAINKMKSGMDSIKSAITSTAKSIQDTVYRTLETADWSKIGSNAITKMKSGMDSIKSAITSVAKSIQETVYKSLETGDWSKIGNNVVTKVKDGMSQIKSSIIDTAKSIQSGIYESLNSGEWYDIGDNIINGIWKGLKDGWDWLESKVWNLAVDLFNAACRALNINSPSKLFAEKVGEMIPAGIGIGITDNEKAATDSIETMSKSLVDTARTIKLPPIAMGEVIPSGIANRNNSDQTTLSSLLDVLQSLQSEMVTKDELEELLTDMFRTHMNIDFHIGDEKLARHVNRGNSLLDRRYNPIRS